MTTIGFYGDYDVPSRSDEDRRIHELERAVQHALIHLTSALNSLDYPREHVSVGAVQCDVEGALRQLRKVL